MTIKIGMVASPSSGKTTLARRLSSQFVGKNIELVTEYARRYINQYGPITNVWEQIRILKKQLNYEETLPPNIDIMITDAPVYMGFAYILDLKDNNNKKDIMLVNDLFKIMNKTNSPIRYDYIFYLPPLEVLKNDGTRLMLHLDTKWRDAMNEKIKFIFKYLFPPKNFIILKSQTVDDRLQECLEALKIQ